MVNVERMHGVIMSLNHAREIQAKIEDEIDPLRMSLHYREAADLLPDLIDDIEGLQGIISDLIDDYEAETALLEQRIQELLPR